MDDASIEKLSHINKPPYIRFISNKAGSIHISNYYIFNCYYTLNNRLKLISILTKSLY